MEMPPTAPSSDYSVSQRSGLPLNESQILCCRTKYAGIAVQGVSMCITLEPVRNADSQVPPWKDWVRSYSLATSPHDLHAS